jgi:hypothetical protein
MNNCGGYNMMPDAKNLEECKKGARLQNGAFEPPRLYKKLVAVRNGRKVPIDFPILPLGFLQI